MPAHDAFDRYRAVTHFANLNGLRFICIVMVIWHHWTPISLPDWKLENRGFLGVDFFFVLSGYLITTLLLRERARYGSFSLRDFYIRRAIRIIPIYYFVVSCVAFYYIVLAGREQYLELLPYYYLFLSNFLIGDIPTLSPTWSLSMEEQYYLVWPLLLMLLPRKLVFILLPVLILANVAVMLGWGWTASPLPDVPLHFKMPAATYAPILIGSLVALLLHYRASFNALWPLLSPRIATPLGFVALIVAVEMLPGDLRGIPNLLIHCLMALVLASLVVKEDNLLSPVLTTPLVSRVGEISYGIYLYHLLALDVVNRGFAALGIAANGWLVFATYGILACLIAEVSFRTLEAYFRRFRPKPRRTAQVVPGRLAR